MSKAGDHGHGGSEKDWEARVTRFKRDDRSGKFMETKADLRPFKGVRKAKKG